MLITNIINFISNSYRVDEAREPGSSFPARSASFWCPAWEERVRCEPDSSVGMRTPRRLPCPWTCSSAPAESAYENRKLNIFLRDLYIEFLIKHAIKRRLYFEVFYLNFCFNFAWLVVLQRNIVANKVINSFVIFYFPKRNWYIY